jgi:predicted HAD superfamily Cof-like phosphohydrolase
MAHCLVSVVAVCDWAAFSYGFDLDPVVREVHLSNMTKVGPDGCVALREDGKVLKGPGYRPPDIAGVLAQTNDRPLAA